MMNNKTAHTHTQIYKTHTKAQIHDQYL